MEIRNGQIGMTWQNQSVQMTAKVDSVDPTQEQSQANETKTKEEKVVFMTSVNNFDSLERREAKGNRRGATGSRIVASFRLSPSFQAWQQRR